jgi:hypothetical protein
VISELKYTPRTLVGAPIDIFGRLLKAGHGTLCWRYQQVRDANQWPALTKFAEIDMQSPPRRESWANRSAVNPRDFEHP